MMIDWEDARKHGWFKVLERLTGDRFGSPFFFNFLLTCCCWQPIGCLVLTLLLQMREQTQAAAARGDAAVTPLADLEFIPFLDTEGMLTTLDTTGVKASVYAVYDEVCVFVWESGSSTLYMLRWSLLPAAVATAVLPLLFRYVRETKAFLVTGYGTGYLPKWPWHCCVDLCGDGESRTLEKTR